MCGLERFGPEAAESIPVLLDCLAKKEHKLDFGGKRPSAEEIRQAVLSSKKYVEGERASVCRILAAVGPKDDQVTTTFRTALANPKEDIFVRAASATELAKLGEPGQAAVGDMIAFLQQTADRKKDGYAFGPRISVIRSLGELQLTKKEIPTLIAIVIGNDDDESIRSNAVDALIAAKQHSSTAWLPILQLLQDQRIGDQLTLKLVKALGTIEAPPTNRKALAKEVEFTFDKLLRLDSNNTLLSIEMQKALKKIQNP